MACGAKETLRHPVRVAEADMAGDLVKCLSSVFDHRARRFHAQTLDGLGGRHAGGSGNASETKPAKLLAVLVVDTGETELTTPLSK